MTTQLKLTEEQFLQQIIAIAHLYHWQVAHFRPARTDKGWRTPVAADGKGFPDLVMARDGAVIFAELKADGKQPSPEQWQWINQLGAHVWHPGDFDAIVEILRME